MEADSLGYKGVSAAVIISPEGSNLSKSESTQPSPQTNPMCIVPTSLQLAFLLLGNYSANLGGCSPHLTTAMQKTLA